MKATNNVSRFQLCVILSIAMSYGLPEISRGGEICPENSSGPDICVSFNGDTPEEDIDFRVDYTTDAANPSVELLTGSSSWNIRSDDSGSAGNIGAITLDPTVNGDDFTVKIANGSGAGAANVGSMVLDGSANPNWTGFSSIAGFTRISGDLGPLTLVQSNDDPPEGGVLDGLIAGGNLTGPINLPIVKGTNILGGSGLLGFEVKENADIVIGEIDGGMSFILANLVCNAGGTVCADITVTGRIYDGLLDLGGSVAAGSIVTVEELEEPSPATGITELRIGDLDGTLDLPNGIENTDTLVKILRTMSGNIDLHSRNVVGVLNVYLASSTAEITNGGAVSGDVYLATAAGTVNEWAGTATFASVSATGEIGTLGIESTNAHLSGDIIVTDTMSGLIHIGGRVLSGGVIDLRSSVSGDIDIESSMSGTVTVTGELSGDIHLASHLSSFASSISVGGSLSGRGRILVDGSCVGSIAIGKNTGSLTLIHCEGGLMDTGKVKINTALGAFDAEGDIHVGPINFVTPPPPALPPAITFDGCIRIFKQAGGNGGDLI